MTNELFITLQWVVAIVAIIVGFFWFRHKLLSAPVKTDVNLNKKYDPLNDPLSLETQAGLGYWLSDDHYKSNN